MAVPLIETVNLKKYFKTGKGMLHAVEEVNLKIEEGKTLGVVGESGCGKSTLLKTLNRMNDLVEGCRIEGQIMLDGENIYDDMDVNLLRKRVGMVFQKPNPFPMSIYDNIVYGPKTHGIHSKVVLDEIVEKSLRSAAIWDEVKDRLKKSALGLSGGQQQRTSIGRAMITNPALILADEPTGNLDSCTSMDVLGLIRSSSERLGQTIVMITHDEEIAQMAGRILRLEDGKIVKEAKSENQK